MLPTQAVEELAPFRCVVGLPRGQRQGYGRSSIRGNPMNFGGPTTAGLANRLESVFLRHPCRRDGP